MKILVLNCGSSSIKYKLFDMTSGYGSRWYRENRFAGRVPEIDG